MDIRLSPDILSPSSSGCFSPLGSESVQTPFIELRESHAETFCMTSPAQPLGHKTKASAGLSLSRNGSVLNNVDKEASALLLLESVSQFGRLSGHRAYRPQADVARLSEEPNIFEMSFSNYSSDSLGPTFSPERYKPRSPICETEGDQSNDITDLLGDISLTHDASMYSPRFPCGHQLNAFFARNYVLEDELGAGGYGFVMTARYRPENSEVAVKFIIKAKVPSYAWMVDDSLGKLPTEVMLLSFIDHKNIVKCLDLFEDDLYFYMVQELHGSPWSKPEATTAKALLTKSQYPQNKSVLHLSSSMDSVADSKAISSSSTLYASENGLDRLAPNLSCSIESHLKVLPSLRPAVSRRPSHDLFECIEQSEHKRLTESQACYVFAQVVDAVDYLDKQGVTHRDLKDENILIDKDFNVKLIDFGSAIIVDPTKPRPYYDLFFGTAVYASSEILLKKPYQAPPAEVWTLGVLLSYLLTGTSPFPKMRHAIEGRVLLGSAIKWVPVDAMDLMGRCLNPDPTKRATISEVKAHRWLSNSQKP